MMSSPWALISLYLTVLYSATGSKLPLPDKSFLSGPNTRGEYHSPPLVWEWEPQDKPDKLLLTLIRMVREMPNEMTTESQPDVTHTLEAEKTSISPLKKSPEVTPHIVLPSKAPYTKSKDMVHVTEDDTTSLSAFDHTTEEVKLKGSETTQTGKPLTAGLKTIATQMKFTSTQEELSTPSSTESKELSVFTKSTANEATTFGQVHSTNDKLLSTIPDSTSNTVLQNTTSTVPSKMTNDTPSKPMLTSAEPTTYGKTAEPISDSKGSTMAAVPVTHISTTSEDKIHSQLLMKQCMLSILILAIVCTIFIITTIALAAKLSTMKQKQKLRHPAMYTEMRCISSLLPESDQQNKAKPKRLKTFAAMEESDGDNTTLNSFLPDH